MAISITVDNDRTTTPPNPPFDPLLLDETAGVQNGAPGSGDGDGNEINVTLTAEVSGSLGGFATAFNTFLNSAALGLTDAQKIYARDHDGASSSSTFVLVTTSAGETINDLFFANASGGALAGVQVVGMKTLDGQDVYLWSNGNFGSSGDFCVATTSNVAGAGEVVAAFYLNEAGDHKSAQVQMVTFEALEHNLNGLDPDDALNFTDALRVGASGSLSFDFDQLASSSSLWVAVGNSNEAVLITGSNPDIDNTTGKKTNDSDVIHTSQGGLNATIGVNNQLFDNVGESATFTLVTGLNGLVGADAGVLSDYAINDPGTDAAEVGIDYSGYLQNVLGAGIFISQDQGSPGATKSLDINVFKTNNPTAGQPVEELFGYVYANPTTKAGDALADDTPVNVTSVTVRDNNNVVVATWVAGADPDGAGPLRGSGATVGGVQVTITGNNIDVNNFGIQYTISWTTASAFDRFNVVNEAGKWDIGRVDVDRTVPSNTPVGDKLFVEDDGPAASANQVTGTVDEDGVIETVGLAGDGIAGGPTGAGSFADVTGEAIVATGSVTSLFLSGTDSPLSYSLKADTSGLPSLTSGGTAVAYTVVDGVNDTLIAYRSGGNPNAAADQVFTFVLEPAGDWTFTLIDQLDHATLNGVAGDNLENDLTIDLSSILQAKDDDNDPTSANPNALVITVDDDTPTQANALSSGTVDEDGVIETVGSAGDGIAGGPAGDGDVAGEAVTATGSVAALFNSGADEPLTYGLSTNTSGLPALNSGASAVAYSVVGNTLTAYVAGGNPATAADQVFTFSITDTATGAWSFTLIDQLNHLSLDGVAGDNTENDLLIQLGSIIQATDKDGDTITYVPTANDNGVVITVDDDTPTQANALSSGTVDEDGVVETVGPAGDGIAGGPTGAGSFADVAGEAVTATGSVAALFNSGADEPLTYGLSTNTSGLPALNSGASAVAYQVVGNTLTAYVAGGNPANAADQVFTFSITNANTGAWSFTLIDQLNHLSLDGVDGDNLENDLLIQLGSIIQATDKDGDTITYVPTANDNGVVITVDDDTPTQNNVLSAGTVDEDGVVENAAPGTQTGDGIAGGIGDVAGEAVTATGSVQTLFNSGADEPLVFGLSSVTSSLPALSSSGAAVAYLVVGNTLTAYKAGGDPAVQADQVFTFSITDTATGAWSFTLIDQLNHLSLDGVAGDNTENDLLIQLGSIIQATDKDGDTITYNPSGTTNGVVITVDDDTAELSGNPVTRHVDEDNLNVADTDLDLSTGILEPLLNDGDSTPGVEQDEVNLDQLALQGVVNSGADEPVLFSLNLSASGAVNSVNTSTGATSPLLSRGQAVTWAVAGGVVQGVTGASTPADLTDDRVVFSISLNANGAGAADDTFTFNLLDQVDHANAAGDLGLLTLDVTSAFNANDFDGDAVDLNGANNDQEPIRVEVENDVPTITSQIQDGTINFTVNASVTNSLNGLIGADDNNASNQTSAGTMQYIITSFNEPKNVFADLDGVLSADGTKVTYYSTSVTANQNASTAVYELALSQTANSGAGSYTFTVLQPAPIVNINFDFTDLPSGQNLFGVIATDKADLSKGGLMVFPSNPDLDANGQFTNASGTINTSKGGGPVTIGNGNQAFDSPQEGAYFLYVDNPNAASVGGVGLTQTGADDADTFRFSGTNEAFRAQVEIVQASGAGTDKRPGPAMHITAYDVDPGNVNSDALARAEINNPTVPGSNQGTAATEVNIVGVKIINENGVVIEFREVNQTAAGAHDGILRDSGDAGTNVTAADDSLVGIQFIRDAGQGTVDTSDDIYSVIVSNLRANYTVEFVTGTEHDLALVQNVSGSYDLGGFNIFNQVNVPAQDFSFSVQIKDYDNDVFGGPLQTFANFDVHINGIIFA